MHLNYHFFKKLVPGLSARIVGSRLLRVFSQDKDELVIEFGDELHVVLTVRAILKPDFTCLYFPEKFERARMNSVDLFRGLVDLRVESAQVYDNERAFRILFETGDKLVFKMFGNRSNLIHFDSNGKLVALFNHKLSSDHQISEEKLSRPIVQTFAEFEVLGGDYKKLFPTFGKLVNRYVSDRLEKVTSLEAKWNVLREVLDELDKGDFYLTEVEGVIALSLLPIGHIQEKTDDAIAASNSFCLSYFRVGNLQREKDQAMKRLTKSINQTESYLATAYEKLEIISDTGRNEQYANLIMANLHHIAPRADGVELENFYTGGLVKIRLKPDLSPAKNAEAYFRKAKNEKLEVEQLQENITAREAGLAEMKGWLRAIDEQSTVKELRLFLKQSGVFRENTISGDQKSVRFRKETYMGYDIFVGKSAKNNDELTLKFAGKEDLWLHAKDVSGSHVIIRAVAGKKVPSQVIERAAELAAWHSKRRNDSLCPVSVTPKKYVRKSKGMPPGAVIVEKESVVMVVPKA